MRYMIHACPDRLWYVENYLLPSMLAQGISPDAVTVWNDTNGKGNLLSFMDSLAECGKHAGGVWHLQDDVIISRDFAEKTQEHDNGIVCGFVSIYGPDASKRGKVPARDLWYSFQCIRIPNDIAKRCALWFYNEAIHEFKYATQIAERKHDDYFFQEFLLARLPDLEVTNLEPNIVDHIDYLIGGTQINHYRTEKVVRALYFPDGDLVEELADKLKHR